MHSATLMACALQGLMVGAHKREAKIVNESDWIGLDTSDFDALLDHATDYVYDDILAGCEDGRGQDQAYRAHRRQACQAELVPQPPLEAPSGETGLDVISTMGLECGAQRPLLPCWLLLCGIASCQLKLKPPRAWVQHLLKLPAPLPRHPPPEHPEPPQMKAAI